MHYSLIIPSTVYILLITGTGKIMQEFFVALHALL
jgi:hypothetical protein